MALNPYELFQFCVNIRLHLIIVVKTWLHQINLVVVVKRYIKIIIHLLQIKLLKIVV